MGAARAARLGLVLACGAAGPAWAQGIDLSHGGPVQVTSQGGFEWREAQQEVIATGDARAVRGNVTVLGDQLIAFYRKKAGAADSTPPASAPTPPAPAGAESGNAGLDSVDNGDTEVYRLAADGHVRIVTPTDEADSDHAIYDIDQAVLVMTGQHMKLTTPQQVMTARDSMEYWSQKHMAVGRGDAVVVTNDGRRISADVLVGYTEDPNAPATPGWAAAPPGAAAQPGAAANTPPRPVTVAATQGQAQAQGGDPELGAGKLKRVEAFGNVEVRTISDTVRGDRGVYLPDTGMARIVGHVRITHGQNQLNGPAADVNMKTGIAHLISLPGARVEGLIMPNDANAATSGAAKPAARTP